MNVLYVLLAVVGGVVALFVAMRIMLVVKATRMKGKPAPELSGKMGKHVSRGRSALFYFYSPNCGACSTMTPVVKTLASERHGVFPIDISRDMATARKFGVMATPTTVVVRKNLVVDVLIGPQPPKSLREAAAAA